MALIHDVYDTDSRFSINPSTRAITKMFTTDEKLVQYDHNSERFAFEMPRMIDGHDMSLCTSVQIHYINIGNDQNRSTGMYDVDDLQVDPNDEDKVICSWLISQNATLYGGTLSFMIRFKCATATGETVYMWNTTTYTGMIVSPSMDNTDAVIEVRADILEQWRAQLFNPSVIEGIQSTVDANTIVCEAEGEDIRVNDSVEFAPREFSIYGRTEQFKSTGKNRISYPYHDGDSKTVNGITFTTNSNGSITFNGTATADATYVLYLNESRTVDNTLELGPMYTLSASSNYYCSENTFFLEMSGYIYDFTDDSGNDVIVPFDYRTTVNDVFTFDIPATDWTYYYCIQIVVKQGYIANNVTVYPMFEVSAEASPYEPYTGGLPAPSPDYPQELNTIATNGHVNAEVMGKNLFNVNKFVELVKKYDSEAVEVTVDGRRCIKTESYRIYKQDFSQVAQFMPNKVYTLSMDIRYAGNYGTNTTLDSLYIGFLYNNESPITADINTAPTGIGSDNRRRRYAGVNCISSFLKAHVTSAAGQHCSGFGFSWSVRGYWYIDLDSIQLEEGYVATTPVPYNHQPMTVLTPNGFPGVPVSSGGNYTDENGQQWVCDEIDCNRGVYISRVGEVSFDANWIRLGEPTQEEIINTKDPSYSNGDACVSFVAPSKLPFSIQYGGGLWEYGAYTEFDNVPNVLTPFVFAVVDLLLRDSAYSTDPYYEIEPGNWLATSIIRVDEYGNPLFDYTVEEIRAIVDGSKMLLIRETPIETPLSKEEIEAYKAITMNKPLTHISNDATAHMKIAYVADTKAYIDNKFAALGAQLV